MPLYTYIERLQHRPPQSRTYEMRNKIGNKKGVMHASLLFYIIQVDTELFSLCNYSVGNLNCNLLVKSYSSCV